jgi:hypothetical protein
MAGTLNVSDLTVLQCISILRHGSSTILWSARSSSEADLNASPTCCTAASTIT